MKAWSRFALICILTGAGIGVGLGVVTKTLPTPWGALLWLSISIAIVWWCASQWLWARRSDDRGR
jgi:hypothetical protein